VIVQNRLSITWGKVRQRGRGLGRRVLRRSIDE
jgi:hypothetical protein